MTGGRATLLFAPAVLLDALKFACTQLWFFGPALIALAGSAAVGGGWFGAAVGTIIGAGAAATAGAAIEMIGVILALAVGLLGWMLLLTLMIFMGIQPLHSRNFTAVLVGFILSEIPFIDAVPSFTVSMWRVVQGQRKADKEARKKWQAENAEAIKQQERMNRVQMKQQLELQAAQEEADEAAAEEQRTLQEQYDALGFQDTEDVAAQLAEEEGPARRPLVDVPSL